MINKTICFNCKSVKTIPSNESDDTTCLCGEEQWVKETDLNPHKTLEEALKELNDKAEEVKKLSEEINEELTRITNNYL